MKKIYFSFLITRAIIIILSRKLKLNNNNRNNENPTGSLSNKIFFPYDEERKIGKIFWFQFPFVLENFFFIFNMKAEHSFIGHLKGVRNLF